MRILQVIPVFSEFFGGPVFDVRSISRELAKRGHEVTVYSTSAYNWTQDLNRKEEMMDGYRVVYFSRVKFSSFYQFFISTEMCKGIRDSVKDFDIVHTHTCRAFPEIPLHHYAQKYGVPYIHQAHGSLSRVGKKYLKYLYDALFGYSVLKNASKVIGLTKVEAEQYMAMGVRKDKIEIIPNGIELSEYEKLPAVGNFKRKYGICDDKKVILYLGRIHRSKGIGFLIKAYAFLRDNTGLKNNMLVIVGPDDGYLKEAKSLARSLGVAENVLFTGLLLGREKISAFVDASLCAYLRPNEPFGRVSLEAAASRTPMVVAEEAAMSHLIKEGGLGFTVKYGDVVKLTEIMKKILQNQELARKMGECGRNFVFENFSWTIIVDKLEGLYRRVVADIRLT